jgi:hypothetical protein
MRCVHLAGLDPRIAWREVDPPMESIDAAARDTRIRPEHDVTARVSLFSLVGSGAPAAHGRLQMVSKQTKFK